MFSYKLGILTDGIQLLNYISHPNIEIIYIIVIFLYSNILYKILYSQDIHLLKYHIYYQCIYNNFFHINTLLNYYPYSDKNHIFNISN